MIRVATHKRVQHMKELNIPKLLEAKDQHALERDETKHKKSQCTIKVAIAKAVRALEKIQRASNL